MDFFTLICGLAALCFAGFAAFFYARGERFRAGLRPLQQQSALLMEEVRGLRASNEHYLEEKIIAVTQRDALAGKLADQESYIKKVQEEFQLRFENVAHRIFDEKQAQSRKSLDELLNPLKENLTGFQKFVSESFGEQAKQQFSLKNEIERIVKVTGEMTAQTDGLSKALRGDIRVQGKWGEVMLERILEASGLRKGDEYILQGAEMGLKHPGDGRIQKPDCIIRMPDNKHVIVDAKVSLTAYERFYSDEDEAAKPAHMAQFIASIKAHVKGLEERRYQDTENLGTPDFVLMFMPIEGAYSLAMQQDRELHGYAWDKKIILVCPSTLFATLRTIASVWKLERQNKNALEIARRGGLLYDKVAGFAEDMERLGKQITATQNTYHDARSKLKDGSGNIIGQAEKLRELGVKHAKNIPQNFLGDGGEEEKLVRFAKELADV